MPYNATWIEPWMRPLKKTARRRRIPNQTANLRPKNASKNIITSPKNMFNRHPNTLEKVRSSTINSRRATRKRRLPSNDWTKRFSRPAKPKDKRPDVLRSKKSKSLSKPLGTSI
jgi:hypothetical protein